MHAWNEETFKNIASIWGELISVDENTIKPISFSRANIQILTNNFDRLNKEILLSVDSKSYRVRIFEFEPSIKPISLWYEEGASGDDVKSRGSSSESSEARLMSGVNVRSAAGLGDAKSGERQKVDNVGVDAGSCPTSRSNVRALNGLLHATILVEQSMQNTAGISERAGDSVPEGDAPRDLSLEPSNMAVVCVDVNAVCTSPAGTIMCNDENPKELLDRALEDVSGMGLGKQETWAEKVNRANSANTLFPEMQDLYRKFTRKYRSLLELQDKALSIKENKRRDHAIRRNNRLEKEKTSLEVEATSPTNSDITRKQILTRSVKKTLALGKRCGIEFISDENEIFKDFIAAEMQEK
ncbi:hypothetical protein V6N13_085279 [Hibiscus sabdariffa]